MLNWKKEEQRFYIYKQKHSEIKGKGGVEKKVNCHESQVGSNYKYCLGAEKTLFEYKE